jgi:hypothetical protein
VLRNFFFTLKLLAINPLSMTTSLPVRGVSECIQRNQTLILFSSINTEVKVQRGLSCVLDLAENGKFFALNIAAKRTLSEQVLTFIVN